MARGELTVKFTELPERLPIMLDTKTMAGILGVSEKFIRDMCKEKQLNGVMKIGGIWRVPRDKFLKQFDLYETYHQKRIGDDLIG